MWFQVFCETGEGLTSHTDMQAWVTISTKNPSHPANRCSPSLSLSVSTIHTDNLIARACYVALTPPQFSQHSCNYTHYTFLTRRTTAIAAANSTNNNKCFTLDFCLEKKVYSVTMGIRTIIIHPWTPPVFCLPFLPFLPTSPTIHQHLGQVKFLLQISKLCYKMSCSIRYQHCDACNNVG